MLLLFAGLFGVVAFSFTSVRVGVPLVSAAPHLGGVAVWLALAGAGMVAIVAAALLDTTRAAVRRGVARVADLTRDWE